MILFLDVGECAVHLLKGFAILRCHFSPQDPTCVPHQTQHERAMIEFIG